VTMLLGGLWHGAGWNFLVWGGLHGLYLCINHLWRAWRGGKADASPTGPAAKGVCWAITFFAVVLGWVFFRARTADGAWQMLGGLFGFGAGSSAYVPSGILRLMDLPVLVGEERLLLIGGGAVALGLAIALALPNVPQLFRLSRIPPRAREGQLAAMAAQWSVGARYRACTGDLAVRHVAAA
jgi:alginate O-acetyltransferase complex protein AlgI